MFLRLPHIRKIKKGNHLSLEDQEEFIQDQVISRHRYKTPAF